MFCSGRLRRVSVRNMGEIKVIMSAFCVGKLCRYTLKRARRYWL